uniref:C2H2-type domain-containing protein n=1 Tax=Mastacembelus armatus TaxID=205130 RepID=A0A7N8XMY3_9TELE
MSAHAGHKPYSCSLCGKRFTKKVNLVVHQRVHTGEKPYSCPDCGVSYAQLGCLRRHRHRHKTHGGENLYSCSFCEKVFSTPSSFRDHIRLHTGQKPHRCSLCCKSFNRPGLLRKHLQKHTEEDQVVRTEGAADTVSDMSQCSGSGLYPLTLNTPLTHQGPACVTGPEQSCHRLTVTLTRTELDVSNHIEVGSDLSVWLKAVVHGNIRNHQLMEKNSPAVRTPP